MLGFDVHIEASQKPRRQKAGGFWLFVFLTVFIVALDQCSKFFARTNLPSGESVPFIPGLIELRLAFNRGAAFSMLSGARWFFVIMALAIVGLIVVYLCFFSNRSRIEQVILAFVAGGALGNLIDRLCFGYVTDFFNPLFMDFAIFNVADIFLCCGCFAFVLYVIFCFPKEER